MAGTGAIDFRAARRQVESLGEVAPEVRQRVFAIWVGLFDFADDELRIEVPARVLSETLGLSRVTWTEYRSVMVAAGLLRVGVGMRGPHAQVLELVPAQIR